MKTRYRALLALMISSFVPNVFPTSGTAIRIAVEEMGARNAQYEMMVTIEILRHGENRLYCFRFASSTSLNGGNCWFAMLLGYCTRVLGVPGGSSPNSDRGLWASSGGNCVVEEFLEHPSSANRLGFCCFDFNPRASNIVNTRPKIWSQERKGKGGLWLGICKSQACSLKKKIIVKVKEMSRMVENGGFYLLFKKIKKIEK